MNPNNDDIVISSVSEYLNQIIYNLQNANSIAADDSVVMEKKRRKNYYYRGEPQKYQFRTPSLYREDSLMLDGSEVYYRELMNELARDSYVDGASLFQILSEMQHYEAKTRMLDITTNPLVALYFAAETHENEDGYIFVYQEEKGGEKFDSGMTVGILAALNFISPSVVRTFSLYMEGICRYLSRSGSFEGKHSLLGKNVGDKMDQLTTDELFRVLESHIEIETPLKISKGGQFSFYGVRNPSMTKQIQKAINEKALPDEFENNPEQTLEKYLNLLSKSCLVDLKKLINQFMSKISRLTKNQVNYEYPISVFKDINKSHIVLTSKKTDRLRQQQGAFIYPSHPKLKIEKNNADKIRESISDSIENKAAVSLKSKKHLRFLVENRSKNKILDELSLIGINKGFIYADIKGRSESIIRRG